MAATVSQVATGLKTRLATISGVSATASKPASFNNPPLAYPVLIGVNYHNAFGGGDFITHWTIVVVTGRWDDERAYETLDGYLSYDGATSVRAALESDRTLGGIVQTLITPSGANIVPQNQGDAEFMQVNFDCTVHG